MVNGQVTDAVTQAVALDIGQSPALAMGLTFVIGAQAIDLMMQNASTYQQHVGTVATAAVSQVCAMIIEKGKN